MLEMAFVCLRFDTQDAVLRKLAEEAGIPVLAHPNVNDESFLSEVASAKCDLFVSMSFNQILKHPFFDLPPKGTINCHAGRLPFYRGRNILNWALINGEEEFGITVHYVDEGVDTGDIILQRVYPITPEDNYATLLDKAHKECGAILHDALLLLAQGTPRPIPQHLISTEGFYCSQRKAGDEWIDWNQSSEEICRFIRALCLPGPRARGRIRGMEAAINAAEVVSCRNYQGIPGAVLVKEGQALLVKTGDGIIKVTEIEQENTVRTGDRFEQRVKNE